MKIETFNLRNLLEKAETFALTTAYNFIFSDIVEKRKVNSQEDFNYCQETRNMELDKLQTERKSIQNIINTKEIEIKTKIEQLENFKMSSEEMAKLEEEMTELRQEICRYEVKLTEINYHIDYFSSNYQI